MKKDKDVKIYKCMNFGACAKADSGELIKIPAMETLGGTPPCPCCKQNTLEEQKTKGGINKKLIAIVTAVLVVLAGAGFGIWSVFSGPDGPKEIEVNQHEKTLNEGDTFQLEVISLGDLKGKVQLEWSVTDGEDCISVDDNGLVTAKREGQGTVNVCLAKKPELQDDCIIKVLRKVNDSVYIREVVPNEVTIQTGEVLQLSAMVEPEGDNSPIEWTSANTEIATVSPDGSVFGCAPGATIITASLHESKVIVPVTVSATATTGGENLGGDSDNGDNKGKGVNEDSKKPKTGYVTDYKLPNGTYTGDIKDGKPHGHGTLKYSRREKVVPSANHYAEPGDSYEGDFRNGIATAGGYLVHKGNKIYVK